MNSITWIIIFIVFIALIVLAIIAVTKLVRWAWQTRRTQNGNAHD